MDLRIIPMLMFTATALIVLALGNVPVAIMLGCLAVIIIS